jgi:hypothetical protein
VIVAKTCPQPYRRRDFNVDIKGRLLPIEEATTMDAIPTPAKAGILKKVGDGKLRVVETYLKTGQPMMYEASYSDNKGKRHEVLVKADGSETKE